MNIGQEGKAFVAEPMPEPVTVEAESDDREPVVVPVAQGEELFEVIGETVAYSR